MQKVKEVLAKIWAGIKSFVKEVFGRPFIAMFVTSAAIVVCFVLGIAFPAKVYVLYAFFMLLLSIAAKVQNKIQPATTLPGFTQVKK